jgi:hypothetical protein
MAFISEVNFKGGSGAAGGEFVEITLAPGDDPADFVVSVYATDGTLHLTSGISGGEVTLSSLSGDPHPDDANFTIYIIPVGIRNANSDANEGSAIALTDTSDGTVVDFFGALTVPVTATEGAAAGATADQVIDHTTTPDGQSYLQDIFGNQTTGSSSSGSSVICISGDSLVACAAGAKPAGQIRLGDLVQTLDHGFQPVRWIGSRKMRAADMAPESGAVPVRISKGALGQDQPERDLLVSPQHRVLLRSKICQRVFGVAEVLVAAKKLIGFDGIDYAVEVGRISYVHIAFDQHEVIFAEAALVESLLGGPEALRVISGDAGETHWQAGQTHPLTLLPDTPARLIARGGKLKKLLERLHQNAKPLVDVALETDPGRAAL